MEILSRDWDNLSTRTKLTLTDIHQLIDLSVSINYFLVENNIRVIDNSGPIGLALMVVISEGFLQHLETKALNQALHLNIEPKSFKRYVDDSQARFRENQHADEFLNLLNSQNAAIQYTIEKENNNKSLNFLDVTIINTERGKYEFKVHRKDAITNIQIKPSSYVNPKLVESILKGFLHRAKKICSSKYLEEEVNFLKTMFLENGHDSNKIEKIISDFMNESNVDQPAKDKDEEKILKLPWVKSVGPKIRKEMKKLGYKTVFTSSRKLKDILCNNKSKLLPNSFPGVYQLKCSCGSVYIGETKKRVLTRAIEHQQDSMNGKWEASGATEHTKSCHGWFDWLHPKTLSVIPNFRERKIRESLEINFAETKFELSHEHPVLNRDRGNLVDTNSWKPLFRKINGVFKRNETLAQSSMDVTSVRT